MAVVGQTRPAAPTLRSPNMRTPLFIFGVALALVAFLVMFAFGIVFVGRTQPSGSVPVVVASQTIDARTPITPDMLTLSSLPAAAVPVNTYLHVSDLTNASAVVDIYKGEPISANLVTKNPDQIVPSTQYLPIPKGFVAFSIPTNEIQGVSGHIAQGDYIDVTAVVSTEQFGQRPAKSVVREVFKSLYVIGIGPQAAVDAKGQKQGVSSSLTVVMSPCDEIYMRWLMVNATLSYSLMSYLDYSHNPPADDGSCTATNAQDSVGPTQVNNRWRFTNG